MNPTLRALAILALSFAASAQVYIVDAANGPGAHFTDLPPAVAAVPDGATLRVRAGSYSPFTITGKGLRVFAEGAINLDRSTTLADVAILNTSPLQTVLLRDIPLPRLFGRLRIEDAKGPVYVEGCQRSLPPPVSPFYPVADLSVLRSPNVSVAACVFDPGVGITVEDAVLQVSRSRVIAVGYGGNALSVLRSRAIVINCTLSGAKGQAGCLSFPGCNFAGGSGGAGCHADASTVLAYGCAISGGTGGDAGIAQFGCPGCCTCPGPGGIGARLVNASLYSFRTSLAGGPAGCCCSYATCTPLSGVPTQLVGNSQVTSDGTITPVLGHIAGTQARNQPVSFTVEGAPGGLAALLLSYRGDLLPLEPLTYGSLLASHDLVIGTFPISALGLAQVPWTLPTTLPLGEVYFGQFATLDPSSRLWLSNTFTLSVPY